MKSFIERFLKMEAAGGILLMLAAAVAMFMANNAWLSQAYFAFLDTPLQVRIAELDINKPLLLWINDGLMAIFFLVIGLEVKRELIEGALSSKERALLPVVAAVGGNSEGGVGRQRAQSEVAAAVNVRIIAVETVSGN